LKHQEYSSANRLSGAVPDSDMINKKKAKETPVYFLLPVKQGIKIARAEREWCKESTEPINKYS